jgi:hypothetical protein
MLRKFVALSSQMATDYRNKYIFGSQFAVLYLFQPARFLARSLARTAGVFFAALEQLLTNLAGVVLEGGQERAALSLPEPRGDVV